MLSLALLTLPSTARADVLGELAGGVRGALDSGSMGLALVMIFAAGFASALTPCVYPMIGITVSIFGAKQAKSRAEAALLSGSFVLGIAALFTPLGMVSALTGSVLGSTSANPWVMIPLSLLFFLMALSMLGAFNLSLPAGLQNRVSQLGGKGYRGSFLVGVACGLVAAPCTGPVLTVLLAWVSTTQNMSFGATSLFVYSLGLGSLFFIVGTFAASLPKSGGWLEHVKSAFGVLMLVLALDYASPFFAEWTSFDFPAHRSHLWAVGAGIATVVGGALGAIHLSYSGSNAQRIRKTLGIILMTGGIFSALGWLSALPKGARIAWQEHYAAAREHAQRNKKPMLVDFGASWCKACEELDHETLADPRVVTESRRFVSVRIDLSAGSATEEAWSLLRDDYGQPGLPFIVLHDREGLEVHRVTGPLGADDFLTMMRSIE